MGAPQKKGGRRDSNRQDQLILGGESIGLNGEKRGLTIPGKGNCGE